MTSPPEPRRFLRLNLETGPYVVDYDAEGFITEIREPEAHAMISLPYPARRHLWETYVAFAAGEVAALVSDATCANPYREAERRLDRVPLPHLLHLADLAPRGGETA